MTQHLLSGFLPLRRNGSRTFLAFFWVSGFLAGLLFYGFAYGSLFSLMHGLLSAPVSIVWLLLASLLPFLFSAFAVLYHTPIWIFPIAAVKAFLFAVVSAGIQDAAGSAGWLLRILLLSGDFLTVPALYLFWLRSLSGDRCTFGWLIPYLVLQVFLLWCVNSCLALPLLAEIGNRWKG